LRRKERRVVVTRRPEARARDEIERGAALPLPPGPLVLYDDARATAVLATRASAPGLVEEVGRLRSQSFSGEAGTTGEQYGLDGYDEYYAQLAVLDKASGTIAAGTRLGLGREIVEDRGWEGFYTAKYWVFGDGMIDVARRGVEVGRTWVHPLHRKRLRGLALLWKALALLLDGRERSFFFGMVSLVGYPEESRALIMNYLQCYHGADADLVSPRHPAPLDSYDRYVAEHEGVSAERALRSLKSAVARIDPAYPIPVLLRHYARFGTELAGGFAESRQANKVSALLLASGATLREQIDRFGAL
jgi:hypothetical protein